MRNLTLLVALGLALTACISRPTPLAAPAVHDLGLPAAPAQASLSVPLRGIAVQGATWLNSNAMQYRYARQQTSRRFVYADNRWAAAPAQLLESRLLRRLALAPGMSRCRLQIRLDEFIQVFDTQDSSRGVLAGELLLDGERAGGALARQPFEIAVPAASADPAGGVVALSAAADQLGEQVLRWVTVAGSPICKND